MSQSIPLGNEQKREKNRGEVGPIGEEESAAGGAEVMRKEGGAETWQSSSCYHLPDAPLRQ